MPLSGSAFASSRIGRASLGPRLFSRQATHPLLLEGADGVADGADGATDPCGDLGRPLALGTGQEDLGASERERLAAAKSGLEFLAAPSR